MRKVSLLLIAMILLGSLCACRSDKKSVITVDDVVGMLQNNNIDCSLGEFQAGRSESFDSYGGDVKILYIEDEEIFLFTYKDVDEVNDKINNEFSLEQAAIFDVNNIILLYRGSKNDVLTILKNNFHKGNNIDGETNN